MQINNLLSKALVTGQVLKLPIRHDAKQSLNNKNHIDINHVTHQGFQSLAASDQPLGVSSLKITNTNSIGYKIDSHDDNPYRKKDLSDFLTSVGNAEVPKPKKKKKKEPKKPVDPDQQQQSYASSLFRSVYDTYQFYTRAAPEKPVIQVSPPVGGTSTGTTLQSKLENVQDANLVKIDPSEMMMQ